MLCCPICGFLRLSGFVSLLDARWVLCMDRWRALDSAKHHATHAAKPAVNMIQCTMRMPHRAFSAPTPAPRIHHTCTSSCICSTTHIPHIHCICTAYTTHATSTPRMHHCTIAPHPTSLYATRRHITTHPLHKHPPHHT